MSEAPVHSLTSPEELVELTDLYDIYGPMLKESYRDIIEQYLIDNLSLSEIAHDKDITRQGVYDIIRRSSKRLRECEEKLGMLSFMREVGRSIDRIGAQIDNIPDDVRSEYKIDMIQTELSHIKNMIEE
ncbi:MAG: hypothetical protein J6P16_03040 [Eubacterium sp.]|nr:hypothetical protein [Eubacterium sp.]